MIQTVNLTAPLDRHEDSLSLSYLLSTGTKFLDLKPDQKVICSVHVARAANNIQIM